MHNRFALLFVSSFLIALAAHSQISISPYSHYGLGDLFNNASTRSFGMGGIGIGAYDQASINRLNPASYADLRLTTFDFNGFMTYSAQKSNLNKQTIGNAGFHNVSLGFSNRKGFGIVAGIAPYTSLGYDVRVRDSIYADTSYKAFTAQYAGSGGLNQFYIGFGVRFLKKVQAGVNLAYAFGSNQYSWTAAYDDPAIYTSHAEKTVSLKGIAPQFGLQYGDTIKVKVKVNRLKEIADLQKELDQELISLKSELADLEKDHSKQAAWERDKQVDVDALISEAAQYEASVKNLMANERENAKLIGKLQDKIYRLDKKRKELQQEIKAKNKEYVDALARINQRTDRIAARKLALDQEKVEIEAGKKDKFTSKTQRFMIRLGGTFDPGFSLKGTQLYRFNNSNVQDTLFNGIGEAHLPSKLGAGFSIAKPNHWMIGADVTLQNWSNFTFFNETNTLHKAMSVNVGGEWIPEVASTHLARKMAYRIGGFYQNSFLTLDNNPIKEVGITAGIGVPIGYYNPIGQSYSRINFGFNLSRRGTLENNLLQELTLQFRLGVNLNDIWFIKRRVD